MSELEVLQEISLKLDMLNDMQQGFNFMIGILCGILLGLIFWSVLKE